MPKTEFRVDRRCYYKCVFKYFLFSGWREHLWIGWGISVFGVCSWLWKLLWWLSMYCHPELGPENHPLNPSVHHNFLSAHCGSLHLQVQWNQGKYNLSKMNVFLQVALQVLPYYSPICPNINVFGFVYLTFVWTFV